MSGTDHIRNTKGESVFTGLDWEKSDESRKVESPEVEGKKDVKDELISFKEIYRYARPLDYILLICGIVLGITQGALNSTSPIIFKGLSDALIVGQSQWTNGTFDYDEFYDGAMHAIYMYVGFGLGIFALAFVANSCWHILCERQIHHIRKRYFGAVLRQNMAWFDVNESGDLTTKMSDGIDRIKDGIGDKMGILFTYTANFISGMVVAFAFSWKMALVMIAFVPLLGGLIGFLVQFVSKSSRREAAEYGKAGAIAEEVIMGIRTVISFNGQTKEADRYQTRLQGAAKFGIRKAFLIAFGSAWIFCLIFVAMGVAFWYGTQLFINNEITAGTVFATFWAVMGGTVAIGQAAPQLGAIMGARTAATNIFKVIDRKPEIDSQSSEGEIIDNPKGEIEFKHIHFRYPTRPDTKVLDDVSVKVPAGKSFALVGHSGCGKSTLIGLLLRFYDEEFGEVLFDGIPIKNLNLGWLRKTIGVVSQEPVLFAATIEENLRLGKEDMTEEEMERVCKMANAHNFIKELPEGYKTRIGEGGVQLSGGQKQRIAIARALARDPKVLLLDEATSALDTESEQLVQRAIDQASAGRTTLTIAHRLSTIRNADCIIVFDHGKIIESGTHTELMELDGVYTQLVRAQEIEKTNKEEENEEDLIGDNVAEFKRFSSINRSRKATTSRMSRRLSRALSNVSAANRAVEDIKEEAEEHKVEPSGIIEIIRFSRKEWPLLIFALVGSIAKGFTFPIFSIIYGAMFKSLSLPSDDEKMAGARMNAIYFSILGICAGIATFTGGFLFGWAGESLTSRLRLKLFRHILRQDGRYFDSLEHAPGKLTTRLATDAPNVRAAIDQRLADVVQSFSAIVSGIAIAFSYGPKMAPIGIVTAVALISAQTIIAQYLKRRSHDDAMMAMEPSRLATEAIEYHKTVQYLTREQHFYDEFNRQMRRPHRRAIVRGLIQAFTFALHVSFIFINFACAYRFGVWLISTNNSDPYTVFQVIEALNCASMSLLAFATYFPEYVRARFSAGLIFTMLAEEPRIDSLADGGKQIELDGNVAMKDLYFAYPANKSRLVLKGVSLFFPKGKTVALVGPSGCGKSTIIQLIERLYDPIDGKLTFDDVDAQAINLRHLRSQIALVGQEPTLFNYSIKENIAYGLENVTQEQIEEAAKLANAHKFITEMAEGYDTCVGEKGSQLSGGQKQRVAIARAVIRNPKVLLLDEATSALDSESEKVVQEALDRARNGRTCIVIAHRLSSIQNSDVIIVMKEGHIIEQGNHQQLLQREGLYARLIKKQNLE